MGLLFLVPDESPFESWCKTKGFNGAASDLVKNADVRKAVQKELESYGRQNGLKGFENVKGVYLDLEPFSADNGLMTPTFKLKVFLICVDLLIFFFCVAT